MRNITTKQSYLIITLSLIVVVGVGGVWWSRNNATKEMVENKETGKIAQNEKREQTEQGGRTEQRGQETDTQEEISGITYTEDGTIDTSDVSSSGITYLPDGTIDTSDWLTYRNEEYGFSFMYPRGWEVRETPGDRRTPMLLHLGPNEGEGFTSVAREIDEFQLIGIHFNSGNSDEEKDKIFFKALAEFDQHGYPELTLEEWIENNSRYPFDPKKVILLENTSGYGSLGEFESDEFEQPYSYSGGLRFMNNKSQVFNIHWSAQESKNEQAYNEFKTMLSTITIL